MKQNLDKYTKEDQIVWKTLFDRQVETLKSRSCFEHLQCLEEMSDVLNSKSIPDFNNINLWFRNRTNWEIEVVPGIIPVSDFFSLLAQKKFCSSTWLRSLEQLDYLEEPDMFHDIFGHIPLLVNPIFSKFACEIGKLGLIYSNNTEVLLELQRLYWFTIEFGLIDESGELKIYGAGIISSFKECFIALSEKVCINSFNLNEILKKEFRTDVPQTLYYKIPNFEELLLTVEHLKIKYYELESK